MGLRPLLGANFAAMAFAAAPITPRWSALIIILTTMMMGGRNADASPCFQYSRESLTYDTIVYALYCVRRLRYGCAYLRDAQLRDLLPISQIGTWALLGPVGCCCPGPRQGIALGAPGPLPGIANRRALRCPLTRCGQCAWQQANGNLPKGAACLTWENVVRGGDGRGEPLTAWAVTGIRGAHHTPSIHALIP